MPIVFLLVLSGATIAGITNVLRKYIFLRVPELSAEVATVALMLGASSALFLIQFVRFGVPSLPLLFWPFFVATAVLNIGIVFWENKATKIEDASIVEPIQGVTPVLVILTAWIMLQELPTFWGAVGIFITVFGVYILAVKREDLKSVKGFLKPWDRLLRSNGARLAFVTAILGSIALNFDKLVVLHSNPAMRGASVFLFVAIAVWSVSVIRGRWKNQNKDGFWPMFGVGLFLGASNFLMDWGFEFPFGIVAYVGSLKRFQIVVTNTLATIFLHEGDWGFRIIAAMIIFAGIFLLVF